MCLNRWCPSQADDASDVEDVQGLSGGGPHRGSGPRVCSGCRSPPPLQFPPPAPLCGRLHMPLWFLDPPEIAEKLAV